MATISEHERASAQRRMAIIRDEIYQLARSQISEGARAEKLRRLVAELNTLEAASKAEQKP